MHFGIDTAPTIGFCFGDTKTHLSQPDNSLRSVVAFLNLSMNNVMIEDAVQLCTF